MHSHHSVSVAQIYSFVSFILPEHQYTYARFMLIFKETEIKEPLNEGLKSSTLFSEVIKKASVAVKQACL